MKTGYKNGEFVYVMESNHIPCKERPLPSQVQIIKHQDLIHMINHLFKTIKRLDVNKKKESCGPEYTMFLLISLFAGYQFGGNYRIPIEIKDKKAFAPDDPEKIEKKKMPKLFNWPGIMKNRVTGPGGKEMNKFKVYKGGLLRGL